MRLVVWLLRAFVFFLLFAFALNNQHEAEVRWFFGHAWNAPMVIVVLAAFAGGAVFGVLAMVPSWWQHRRLARRSEPAPVPAPAGPPSVPPSGFGPEAPPRDLA